MLAGPRYPSHRGRSPWPGSGIVFVIGGRKESTQKIARSMAKRYGAGKDDCFSYKFPFEGFPDVSESCFKSCDSRTKLMICGHGHKLGMASAGSDDYDYEARHIAGILQGTGMKQVGLISFKACDIGKKEFLENLLRALKGTVDVGYVIGYKGGVNLDSGGKMRSLLGFKAGTKIVKGTLHVPIPSKRFLKKAEEYPDDPASDDD
jgi:hypothetical protein